MMRLGGGYTLDDVAAATGIERTKISRGERGFQRFTVEERRRLAEFLGTSRDLLFPESEDAEED
jgi:transcriptional regulator with XRE-family HTH domain